MHIVGTPSRIVVRVSVISASAASGSNRRTIAIAAPESSVEQSPVARPSTCENGAAPSITSSGPSASAAAAFSAAARSPPCVRIAPFGLPEVPEVNRITAGSASSRSTRATGSPPPSSSPSSATSTRAVDASSRASISGGARSVFSGTTIVPSRSAPRNPATNAGPFGSSSATRSPGPTPRPRRTEAATPARRSISA